LLRIAIGQDHEAEGVRATVGDHGQVVRGAGRALGLDEEVAPTGLRGHAPGSVGLGAVAAQAGRDFGDRLVGVEHHQRHDAALDRHGDHRARVVDHLAQARVGGFRCGRRDAVQRCASEGSQPGQRLHGLAPGAAVLISGSDR
jgi:hypothetical protein